jgi:hypothetical protein
MCKYVYSRRIDITGQLQAPGKDAPRIIDHKDAPYTVNEKIYNIYLSKHNNTILIGATWTTVTTLTNVECVVVIQLLSQNHGADPRQRYPTHYRPHTHDH